MPKVSQFFGVLIYMYFRDHAPPHFHAQYGDFEALIEIKTLYSKELTENWEAASLGGDLRSIPPLQ